MKAKTDRFLNLVSQAQRRYRERGRQFVEVDGLKPEARDRREDAHAPDRAPEDTTSPAKDRDHGQL